MKVILLQDVKSLGKKDEVVDVSDGYARNFVLPKKLGVEANAKNMNDLKLKKANSEKQAKEQYEEAKAFAEAMEKDEIVEKGEGPLALSPPKKSRRPIRNSAARKSIRKRFS